jgi:hypothetical protein
MSDTLFFGMGKDALGGGLSKIKHGKKIEQRLRNRGTAKNRRPSKMYAESGPRSGSREDRLITKHVNEMLAARRARAAHHEAKLKEMELAREKAQQLRQQMGVNKSETSMMKARGGTFKGIF